MRNQFAIRATVVLAGLLLAEAAQASTICVSPSGGSCQTTIQAAVTLANPLDRIMISPGVYFENVVVPPGKDGLQISGVSRTRSILDASPYTPGGLAGNTGNGLTIQSRGVLVRNLTIRHGQQSGIFIQSANNVIQQVTFYGQDEAGVEIDTLDDAYNNQVVSCDFKAAASGVVSGGHNTSVRLNRFTDTFIGVVIDGNNAQVVSNRMSSGTEAISVVGGGALVKLNDVRNFISFGIVVDGPSLSIEGNRLTNTGAQQGGILADCEIDCTNALVAGNILTDSAVANYGIGVVGDAAGAIVQNNVILRGAGTGPILTSGDGMIIRNNRVTDAGLVPSVDCINVSGSFNYLFNNMLSGCPASGIYIQGSDNYLERNTAANTPEGGFTLSGYIDGVSFHTDNLLVGNRTLKGPGQGIAIVDSAQNTAVIANTATGNRTDFCNEGTGTSTFGNTFGTTNATCYIKHH